VSVTPATRKAVTVRGLLAVIVIAAVPETPSLAAVIVASPGVTPFTHPAAVTVATARALLTQVTVRPVRTLPFASASLAVSRFVTPTPSLRLLGVTTTDATGAVLVPVVPLATLDSPPNTAFTFSIPRNATSWN